uniref:Uncharacterized protein n=1 Tax=Rhizophora mucronata TaxID=61149 RepID=A0A2P2PS57_RHIMU
MIMAKQSEPTHSVSCFGKGTPLAHFCVLSVCISVKA